MEKLDSSRQTNDKEDTKIKIERILPAMLTDIQGTLSPCPLTALEPYDEIAETWNSESRT